MSTACTPGMVARGLRVDAADGGVGVRAAHEGRLQHVGKAQVVDEAAGAGQQREVLDPLDGMADVFGHLTVFFWRPLAERGPIGSGWNGPSRMSR